MKKMLSSVLVVALLATSGCSSNSEEKPSVEAVKPDEDTELVTETVMYQAPYYRVAGYANETRQGYQDLPIAVWVDFNPSTDTIMKVHVVGDGNPYLPEEVQEILDDYSDDLDDFYGLQASDIVEGNSPLDHAIYQASQSYQHTKDKLIIRPYQSMMTQRYLSNNPYIVDNSGLSGVIEIETEIVALYPSQVNELASEDIRSGENIKYPSGKSVAMFTNDNGEYSINSGIFMAKEPGIAVIRYTYNGLTVYDAVDIYENFTLDLSGSDAYGLVIAIDEDDDEVSYRVLGDKAMNFPGGTCGSTVVDVTIDKAANTIVDVTVVEHSDSTYLANPWEYDGGFVNTGDFIYHIDAYCDKFTGLSADKPITPFVVATKDNPHGGTVVEDGIDMVVSGATRTANAIIYAVNAAIEQYNN